MKRRNVRSGRARAAVRSAAERSASPTESDPVHAGFCLSHRAALGLGTLRLHNARTQPLEDACMSIVRKLCLASLAAAVVLLAGCATSGGTRQATSAALDRILAGNHRSEANRARDIYRHPKRRCCFSASARE